RGVRRLRRGRACRGALPVVLRDAHRRESRLVEAVYCARPARRHRPPRRSRGVSLSPGFVSVLIPAVGGQGGGVLAEWIVEAAIADGYVAHGTSIPGVAQRTGSTTYYAEVFPARDDAAPTV